MTDADLDLTRIGANVRLELWRRRRREQLRDMDAFARSAGFELDPWQREFLVSDSKATLLNCTRQGGKSTSIGLKTVYKASSKPGFLSLLLSPSLRQSQELFRNGVLEVYRRTGRVVPATAESALRIEFENGSRIISLPGKEGTVRGYAGVDLLAVDEAARVPTDLYMAVRPMLAVSGGELIGASTPWGTRGWWYDECKRFLSRATKREGGWRHIRTEGWEYFEVPATACPRISDEYLADERERMGQFWFDQEFMCTPPVAPVWMGDYTFKPIGEVRVGDEVIGWTRNGFAKDERYTKRYLKRAKVLAIGRREAHICKVTMESGRVIYCTPDHQWLTTSVGSGKEFYMPADVGRGLVRVVDEPGPLVSDLGYEAAWLGGIYDGEGCRDHIAQCPLHNPEIYTRIGRTLEALGIRGYPNDVGWYITGDDETSKFQSLVNLVNWGRITKKSSLDHLLLKAHFRIPDRVMDVSYEARGEVVSMQTATGNYIVWGYASKNCNFLDAESQAFRREDIDAIFDEETEVWEL